MSFTSFYLQKIFTLRFTPHINKVLINKCCTKDPAYTIKVCDPFPPSSIGGFENRPKRQEPGKVQLGFIPEEWFLAFVPKTGYTGFYTLLFTTWTYLFSKEIYVLDHEFYNGLSMAVLVWWVMKNIGPKVAAYADREIELYEKDLAKMHKKYQDDWKKMIEQEHKAQVSAEGELILLEFKRQNVQMQLEAEKRRRQMVIYKEVKRRLDYQVDMGNVLNRFLWWNQIDYVFYNARETAPAEIKDEVRNMSITDFPPIIKQTTCEKS